MRHRRRLGKGLLAAAGIGLGMLAREALLRRREADLRGQVALVTGGSRGLGYLLAREFGRQGCRLAICARDAAELERAGADLAAQGFEVFAAPCDVGDRDEVAGLVAAATGRFGRVDILVNNAGVIQAGPIDSQTEDDFREAMDVMFWGVLYPTLAVLPQMRARRSGRIVNVTSVGGKVAAPHLVPYDCAKFAAVALLEGLRAELAREGITVTTIAPGLMRTVSALNAIFKGPKRAEFTAFTILGTMPFISMDAERAARQIVEATRCGEAERILGLPANLLARCHSLFPGTTADVLGVVNRVLPHGDDTARARGMELHEQVRSPLLDQLMGWTLSAARRFHEYPGPVTAGPQAAPDVRRPATPDAVPRPLAS
ncbi:MAG TPA: SDR family oxidoreductase [Chloroflexota bacterium]|jgi:NAD(P)-dependent dehydrogenase (short-subunit alcohol dehydrogenase family)